MRYLVQGFLLGLAYVAPIGMQNMYVINAAMRSSRLQAVQVALITIFFDVTLALACFFGVGVLLSQFPTVKGIVLIGGSFAVLSIGISLLKSRPEAIPEAAARVPLRSTVLSCFAVTWLNPQAVIDGSLLLGGFRASLPPQTAVLFIAGVAAASCAWFLSLAILVSSFRHLLTGQSVGSRNGSCPRRRSQHSALLGERVLRWINILSGLLLIMFAIRLGLSAISTLR